VSTPPSGPPPLRIDPNDTGAVRAKNALMIASQELRLFAYHQPYDLDDPEQRAELEHTLATEFNRTIEMPAPGVPSARTAVRGGRPAGAAGVFYLIVLRQRGAGRTTGEPVLVPESDVLAFVFGFALAASGRGAAQRVHYRTGMLTA
jgi:hypothetical protein